MAYNEANRHAETLIEKTKQIGATDLKLNSSLWYGLNIEKLTELPESLYQLRQLQSLDLSGNELTELPGSLGQLTQLQSLDLSGNELTELPESLGQLTQLQSLDLAENLLETLPESLTSLTQLQSLDLSGNELTELPESLGQFTQLQSLHLAENLLETLPESLGQLTQLLSLDLSENLLETLPKSFRSLVQLQNLWLFSNTLLSLPSEILSLKQIRNLDLGGIGLINVPEQVGRLIQLEYLMLDNGLKRTRRLRKLKNRRKSKRRAFANKLTDLPSSLARLEHLRHINLEENPLNPELDVAYRQGIDAVKTYLRAKSAHQVILNEAKLILVGEGEVGKTCLMDALEGRSWQQHDTTHGIEIRSIQVVDPESGTEITLNGWDFGGQRVYRPTHQLFFTAPAVYLVIWKPREGTQQGFVEDWIKLIIRREPDAKILVVATHGGPRKRQPDIDRQELQDLFGKDTVLDFFFVESKPNEKGERWGIEELKQAIARVALNLPETGRSVPKRWQKVRKALEERKASYLPVEQVFSICREYKMEDDEARLFVTISHHLGHLIHYEHDPALRDIVVLQPDWLATAISFVLDDEETRKSHGVVSFSRLSQLWDDPNRAPEQRYSSDLHPLFLRLMERFDLSYKVALLTEAPDAIGFWQQFRKILNKPVRRENVIRHLRYTSLIAQLVPDIRPVEDLKRAWPPNVLSGDEQHTQICRIVDEKGQPATAEGLFYQLIVRLHKYSLGRENYHNSVHWQHGLVLDDNYNGRALLVHKDSDVRITVRAPYPERFLAMLTEEVKYLVENFWEGLRCDVMVPCITPCGQNDPGTAQYEVEKLIDSKRKGRPDYPCSVCNEWQNIDLLLRNAPSAQPIAATALFAEFAEVKRELLKVRYEVVSQGERSMGRFDGLDERTRRILSKVDDAYTNLLRALTAEAIEGPRLFSLVPLDRSSFNPREWTSSKFCLTLWCEHSRLPLPSLNGKASKAGIYEIELTRAWFRKTAPFLKVLTGTLSLVLPVASSGVELALDDAAFKVIEEHLEIGKNVIDASLAESETVTDEQSEFIRAKGGTLRELHALLKARDPSFGGLVRVMNKRQEFLWVHPQFEAEY